MNTWDCSGFVTLKCGNMQMYVCGCAPRLHVDLEHTNIDMLLIFNGTLRGKAFKLGKS